MQISWQRIWLRRRVWRRNSKAAPSGKQGVQLFISVVLGVGLALALICTFDLRARPFISTMAEARTKNVITTLIDDAVNRTLSEETIAYGDMITLQTDSSGRITALISNSAELNRLRTAILDQIVEQVKTLDTDSLGIPMGNLTGFATLSDKGPMLPVRVLSVGSAEAAFHSVFSSAGINQTRHRIVLEVNVSVKLLVPGQTIETVINAQVDTAETVLLGEVPQTYLQFPSAGAAAQ